MTERQWWWSVPTHSVQGLHSKLLETRVFERMQECTSMNSKSCCVLSRRTGFNMLFVCTCIIYSYCHSFINFTSLIRHHFPISTVFMLICEFRLIQRLSSCHTLNARHVFMILIYSLPQRSISVSHWIAVNKIPFCRDKRRVSVL